MALSLTRGPCSKNTASSKDPMVFAAASARSTTALRRGPDNIANDNAGKRGTTSAQFGTIAPTVGIASASGQTRKAASQAGSGPCNLPSVIQAKRCRIGGDSIGLRLYID